MKTLPLGLLLFALPLTQRAAAAPPPKVEELRIQKVGDSTYFHVRFASPRHLLDNADNRRDNESDPRVGARLVPGSDTAKRIYQLRDASQGRSRFGRPPRRGEIEGLTPPTIQLGETPQLRTQRAPVAVQGLEFVGKTTAVGNLDVVLLYPRESRLGRVLPGRRTPLVAWEEVKVRLDLAKAKEVSLPEEAKKRRAGPAAKKPVEHPIRDDLEGLWAAAQVDHFARVSGTTPEFGFHPFASEATARKYNVPRQFAGVELHSPLVPDDENGLRDGLSNELSALYETTTGAAAITESLAMRRLLATGLLDNGKRTRDVANLRGIEVAEHPWEKMMAGKKPADEPLAQLIPHDNYYLCFNSMRKINELGDLLDRWGSSLQQAWQLNSRDARIKDRYERQLCLRSTALGRTLGPLVIKSLAMTGSDAYLREGSDLTIIFHVNNRELFLSGVQGFIEEAKKQFTDLKTSQSTYQDIAIESRVTPLREVSVHRCWFDEYVVYSNSLAGLQRVLDAHKGKRKRLSAAQDFQYMRTIFRADAREEDGFLFLSDAFIRQLVGPASKIKEKRRLEALTSLHTITNGALFTAWETGRQPAAHRDVIAGANLKPHEVPMPEGKPAVWDDKRQLALSDAYNTIHFPTPLVELPIDKVTEAEAQQYERFRLEYLGLWRQYFDPVGVRFALKAGEVKVETYILPLIENSQYNELRRVTGGGTISYDSSRISPATLFQTVMHLSPSAQLRESLFGLRRGRGAGIDLWTLLGLGLGPIGKWGMVRVDDSEVYGKLAALLEKSERGEDVNTLEIARLVFDMPVMVGVDIKNAVTFGAALAAARLSVLSSLPGGVTWGPLEKDYKGVQIVRIHATAETARELVDSDDRVDRAAKPFEPSIYYAMIDGGFYLTLNEKMLKDFIDEAEARKKGEAKPVAVNSALYLSPGAAKLSGVLLRKYLEEQVHQQALANLPVLEALHGCGVLPAQAGPEQAKAAFLYLGYAPLSPDGSTYRYDAARGEMINERHGSLRAPTKKQELADGSPLKRLLEELRSGRAELRFREDGIHTSLTLDRARK